MNKDKVVLPTPAILGSDGKPLNNPQIPKRKDPPEWWSKMPQTPQPIFQHVNGCVFQLAFIHEKGLFWQFVGYTKKEEKRNKQKLNLVKNDGKKV